MPKAMSCVRPNTANHQKEESDAQSEEDVGYPKASLQIGTNRHVLLSGLTRHEIVEREPGNLPRDSYRYAGCALIA
jgi:hypothetical protein